jgi:hypothetical protein
MRPILTRVQTAQAQNLRRTTSQRKHTTSQIHKQQFINILIYEIRRII